jgi:hypothetical protein
MTSTTVAFSRVRKAARDVERAFVEYKKATTDTIRTSDQIREYIRDWQQDDHVESEYIERSLDRLRRDSRIYTSRIAHINESLDRCMSVIERAAPLIQQSQDTKERRAKLDECVKTLTDWHHLRRDFDKCFRAAKDEWEYLEHKMIDILDTNRPGDAHA